MQKVLSYFSLLKITDKHNNLLELICFQINWSSLCECCPLQVDPVKLRQALKCVTLNQLFISGPIVVAVYQLMSLIGNPCGPELPTFHRALMELSFFSIVEEILFYYSHRWGSLLCHCVKSHSSVFNVILPAWTSPCGLSGCSTIHTSINVSTSSTMSGLLPLEWWPPMPILWSMWWVGSFRVCRVLCQGTSLLQPQTFVLLLCYSSPTCCLWSSGRWFWAPTSPPPACGTAWLWSAPQSPTVDTTFPSCLPQNSTTFTISGASTSLFPFYF